MAAKLNKFQMVGFDYWKGELNGQALVKSGKNGETLQ